MKTNRYNRRALICFTLVFAFFILHLQAFADNGATSAETVISSSSGEVLTAVYAYGGYKIELRNATYASGGKDDGVMLTDRKYTVAKPKSDKIATEGWVMLESYDGSTDFRATITVDFGFLARNVVNYYLRAFRSVALGAEMPDKIRFYISENGSDFSLLGEGTTMTDISVDNSAAVYSVNLKSGKSARYMRVIIDCKGGTRLWLNELGAAALAYTTRVNSDSDGIISDSQGLKYRINGASAEVVGAQSAKSGAFAKIKPSEASFDTNRSEYVLGVGSGNEVNVITDFIGEGRPNYSGVPNNIKYIIIHNTGTTEESTDAERYNKRMHTTDGETSWHYTVDENIIYHSLADSIVGWHAGSSHNYESIGIEICTNGAPTRSSGDFVFSGSAYENWVENRFKKSLRNTAVLVAELLTRYGLSTDAVIQHYDVTEKNCPLWLREKNGKFVYEGTLWLEFMSYVEEYYALFNGDSPTPTVIPNGSYIIPDYIATNDGEVYPVTKVNDSALGEISQGINRLHIGLNVESISQNAFFGTAIESFSVDGGNAYFYTEGGMLYSSDKKVIYSGDTLTSIVPTPKYNCTLDIKKHNGNYYLYLPNLDYTLKSIADEYGASVYSANDINGYYIEDGDTVTTGAVIRLDGARLYAVVLGDVNGDCVIDEFDYILIKRTYLHTFTPQKRQYYAILTSGGEEVSVFDYILVKRHVFGTYNLFK